MTELSKVFKQEEYAHIKGKDLEGVKLYIIYEKYDGYYFKIGINSRDDIDEGVHKFKSDFYFCQLSDIFNNITNGRSENLEYIREVTLEDDWDIVPVGSGKFRSTKITLSEQQLLKDFLTYDICKFNLEHNGKLLKYVLEAFNSGLLKKEFINKENLKELYYVAIKNNGQALEFIPEFEKIDDFYKIAVMNSGFALQHVPAELRTYELCKASVTNDGYSLEYVPKDLIDELLCKLAVKSNSYYALRNVPKCFLNDDLYKLAVENDGRALCEIPYDLRTEELCMIAIKNNGLALQSVPHQIKSMHMCLIAFNQYPETFMSFPEEILYEIIKAKADDYIKNESQKN